jgi:hypothetical protein
MASEHTPSHEKPAEDKEDHHGLMAKTGQKIKAL